MLSPRAVLFNSTNMSKDKEDIFRKFADGIKLGRVGDMLEGKTATPIDLNNLKKCAGRKDVIFKGKQSPESLEVTPWTTTGWALPG